MSPFGHKEPFYRGDDLAKGEHNDCAVRCIAIATGISYDAAHRYLAEQGRKHRHRTPREYTFNVFSRLGYTLIQETDRWPARTITGLEGMLPIENTYIVITKGHILTFRGGRALDWTTGRRQRPLEVYRLVKVRLHDPRR